MRFESENAVLNFSGVNGGRGQTQARSSNARRIDVLKTLSKIHFNNSTLVIVPGDKSICIEKSCFNFPNNLEAPNIIEQKQVWKKTISAKDQALFFSAIWLMNNI